MTNHTFLPDVSMLKYICIQLPNGVHVIGKTAFSQILQICRLFSFIQTCKLFSIVGHIDVAIIFKPYLPCAIFPSTTVFHLQCHTHTRNTYSLLHQQIVLNQYISHTIPHNLWHRRSKPGLKTFYVVAFNAELL